MRFGYPTWILCVCFSVLLSGHNHQQRFAAFYLNLLYHNRISLSIKSENTPRNSIYLHKNFWFFYADGTFILFFFILLTFFLICKKKVPKKKQTSLGSLTAWSDLGCIPKARWSEICFASRGSLGSERSGKLCASHRGTQTGLPSSLRSILPPRSLHRFSKLIHCRGSGIYFSWKFLFFLYADGGFYTIFLYSSDFSLFL